MTEIRRQDMVPIIQAAREALAEMKSVSVVFPDGVVLQMIPKLRSKEWMEGARPMGVFLDEVNRIEPPDIEERYAAADQRDRDIEAGVDPLVAIAECEAASGTHADQHLQPPAQGPHGDS